MKANGLRSTSNPSNFVNRLCLKSAMGKLSLEQRSVLELRFWESFTIEEIADQMNLSWGQVDYLLDRGLKTIRELYFSESLQRKPALADYGGQFSHAERPDIKPELFLVKEQSEKS